MSDRRRNVRVSHQNTVRFEGESGVIEGRSVDISRSGMQIVVDLPGTDAQNITFTLPNADRPVRIPVRITRQDSELAEGYRLGLEFQFEAAEQMRLIDRYIRERKEREIETGNRSGEARQIPRCDCDITEVRVSGLRSPRIANISTEGLLLEYTGALEPGRGLELSFFLPEEKRETTVQGEVVYVVQEGVFDRSVAGVRFTRVKEVDRARIRNFILGATSTSAVRSVHLHVQKESEFTVTDSSLIKGILRDMGRRKRPLHLLLGEQRRIRTAYVGGAGEEEERLPVELEESVDETPPPGTTVYGSFHHHRGSYLFSASILDSSTSSLTVTLPDRLYRTEKRSYQRKVLDQPREVRFAHGFSASLVDISWRGFLCTAELPEGQELPLREGDSVRYEVDEALGLDSHGQVRHLSLVTRRDGTREVQIGVEAGVRRSSFSFTRVDESEWAGEERFPAEEAVERVSFESTPILITNPEGKRIVALLNSTGRRRAPVVLIPPAFGKKKETLAPLAATLLANAAHAGEDLIVLRFDGINRPGESHNDNPDRARGYEMLHYRPRQGVEDIAAVMDYIYDNPYFEPEGVALFTSSMSSVDARKFLIRKSNGRVHAWVSLMGVPAARTTLSNILAGTDIIANAKMGIRNGIRGMLGHLVEMDLLARDLIEEKYAYLTDARYEMANLALPILWIYGAHDRWVESEEVEDLMSIDGGARRELVEVPTGHNLRGSRDAIEAFKLATRFLFETLLGRSVDPVSPPKEATVELVTQERERLEEEEVPEMSSYWHEYLMGNERNEEGYDFYRNFAEFREFMRFQVELLRLREGEEVADMGCGTGVVTESILQLAGSRNFALPRRIVGVDLVPAALDRAQEKCEELQKAHPKLRRCEVEFVSRNLEPNRLIPIREFIARGAANPELLRNRVEGLTSRHVDAIRRIYDPEVRALLRGEPEPPGLLQRLRRTLEPGELEALLDLRAVARYLKRRGESDSETGIGRRGDSLSPKRLKLDHFERGMDLGFAPRSFDKIVASLFISYIFNPDYLVAEFRRLLRPGGAIVISSMRPDSDVSTIFTDYVSEVQASDYGGGSRRVELEGAQAILSEAAALFELEEEGYFHFYTEEELTALLTDGGFERVEIFRSLGKPPQAVIARGFAP